MLTKHLNNPQPKNQFNAVLFTSRNKDNRHVENFKQRNHSFITTKPYAELKKDFQLFTDDGVDGELSRCYLSINARNNQIVQKKLQHYLLDHDEFNLCTLPQKIASLAMRDPSAAVTNRWLFDYDDTHVEKLENFKQDILTSSILTTEEISVQPTPNGYAVIVAHGFDTRELLANYPFVELKRDAMLCVDWDMKNITFPLAP